VSVKLHCLGFVFVIGLLAGCASNKMMDSAIQSLPLPSDDEATVVFMRVSSYGGAIQAALFDATGSESEFIGIISTGKKIAYTTSPGPHRFMVVSEAADFLEADLLGGRTYYAMVTPRMGAWKARFSLYPVSAIPDAEFSLQSEKFDRWQETTDFIENTDASRQWARDNMASVQEKRTAYEAVWAEKSEAALAERTLRPEDGVD
jgi:hypothetical protein